MIKKKLKKGKSIQKGKVKIKMKNFKNGKSQ